MIQSLFARKACTEDHGWEVPHSRSTTHKEAKTNLWTSLHVEKFRTREHGLLNFKRRSGCVAATRLVPQNERRILPTTGVWNPLRAVCKRASFNWHRSDHVHARADHGPIPCNLDSWTAWDSICSLSTRSSVYCHLPSSSLDPFPWHPGKRAAMPITANGSLASRSFTPPGRLQGG